MAVSRINEAGLNINQYGNRNVIINGAMQVAQRGTSSTGLGSGAGYFTCDRWSITGTASAGRLTMTQESDGPSGFANSMKLACTTADTSVAAGEKLILRQILEGQDLQQFAKGTSDAKEFTVSFYVKGNASATYVFELFDSDNTRQISKTFSVTTDWTRVILTFPADTTGAFSDDNGISLYAQIWLHAGSDFTSGTLNSSAWAAQTVANRASSSATSFFDSTARTFFITGVQLEVGDTATDFEHRSFGDELIKCKRYFTQWTGTANQTVGIGVVITGTTSFVGVQFPIEMRTGPTITESSTYIYEPAASTVQSLGTIYNDESSAGVNVTHSSGLTTGRAAMWNLTATGSYVRADAEL